MQDPRSYFRENQLFNFDNLFSHCLHHSVHINTLERFSDLVLLKYEDDCQWENKWSTFSRFSRGLVVDMKNQTVLSHGFDKFFNLGQMPETNYEVLKDKKEFEISEKLDGCLDYQTTLYTDAGPLKIGKIVNNQLPVKILSYNHKLGIAEFKPIQTYHKYEIGDKKLFQIAFKRKGRKDELSARISCTDNHEFYTSDGYKAAKDLRVGDMVYRVSDILSEVQKQVLIGGLLGDTGLCKNSNSNSFVLSLCQGIAQKEYLSYKAKLLGNLFVEHKTIIGQGFSGSKPRLKGGIHISSGVNNLLYSMGLTPSLKRIITSKIANFINPLGLAIWYMDDGSLQHGSNGQRPRVSFATNSFSRKELEKLQKALKIRFNLIATIHNKLSYKGNVLDLDSDSSEILFELIAPYVCRSMKYKLPQKYVFYPCVLENVKFKPTSLSLVSTTIKSIRAKISKETTSSYVYDLTIPDNHNYFAHSILIHNSCLLSFLNPNDNQFYLTTTGSFDSEHGKVGTEFFRNLRNYQQVTEYAKKGTLIFELITSQFRIVIDYKKKEGYLEGLYLIGYRDQNNRLYTYAEVASLATELGLPCMKTYKFESLDVLMENVKGLSVLEEGFVLRYPDGLMVKIKGMAYLKAHRFISQLSDKHILEAVAEGVADSLVELAPEEYRQDVIDKIAYFKRHKLDLLSQCYQYFAEAPKNNRKEFALWVQANAKSSLRGCLFQLMDGKSLKDKDLYAIIKKTENISVETRI